MERCKECGRPFNTGRGLATHRGMVHKVGPGGKPLPPNVPSIPSEDLDLPLDELIAKHGAARVGESLGKNIGDFVQGFWRGLESAGSIRRRFS